MKRALIVTERFAPDLGGVARSSARIADAFVKLGLETQVFTWTKTLAPGSLATIRRDSGESKILVHRLGLFANWDLSLQHTLNSLHRLHKQSNVDFVWGHYLFPAGFLATFFAKQIQVPSCVSARGNDIDQMMFPPGDFSRLMWTLQNASKVTAVSEDLKNKIEILLDDDSKTQVIPNVVDSTVFKPRTRSEELATALNIQANETVLGFSGELKHKKGYPFLLSAFQAVSEKQACKLLVIGELRARVSEAFAAFKSQFPEFAERIIITGHLQNTHEIVEHMELCDIFLFPSVWDGLPNALLEAMSMKKLVIGSDAGGIPDVIKHGENGVLIPTTELHRLGEAILELLSLPQSRLDAIRENARHTILTERSPEHEDEALRNILDRIV